MPRTITIAVILRPGADAFRVPREFPLPFPRMGDAEDRDEERDDTDEERFGRVGKQRIEDTGPLTRKRMETCDDEFVDAAADFIQRQHNRRKPFFCWVNTTHMHFRTHVKDGSRGKAGRWQSEYHDTMCDHDELVGSVLDYLDENGLTENTIVMYSTDNGAEVMSW